jgi:hypothetical protein
MFDLKIDNNGDLELTDTGDVRITESIVQAVRIRLFWFFREWRLGPALGFPYFEDVFVKNPNEAHIKGLIRDTIMGVKGVTDVLEICFSLDRQTREVQISVVFTTAEETFREEVRLKWNNTD